MNDGAKKVIPNTIGESKVLRPIQWVALAIVGGAIGFGVGWYVWGLMSINTYLAVLVASLLAIGLRNGISTPPVIWGHGRTERSDG